MAAFSLRLDLAEELNRHFLENNYGDLLILGVLNFSMYNKYGPILSVELRTIVGNVNLASNPDYNHGAIIRIYMV